MEDKNLTARWWIAPLVATLAVATAGCFGSIELGAVGGFVFGLVFFVVALTRHHDELVRDVITNPVEKKTHNDTETVFMADFGQGQVPAKLRFISTSRIIKIVVWSLVVIFLPLIIAVPIQLMKGCTAVWHKNRLRGCVVCIYWFNRNFCCRRVGQEYDVWCAAIL